MTTDRRFINALLGNAEPEGGLFGSAFNQADTRTPEPFAGLLGLNPPTSSNSFGGLLSSPPPTPAYNFLAGLNVPPAPVFAKPTPTLPVVPVVRPEPVKRKVYFAFDFDDLIRVNNVRQIGKIGPREQKNPRTFSDRSIWESRNIKNEDNLKNLMRHGVRYGSVVCVLVGTSTWRSRWTKYEIARAIVDERGLLAVHVNSINHNIRQTTDSAGINPLHIMGVFHSPNGNHYLYEKHPIVTDAAQAQLGYEWRQYEDFLDAVPLPRYIPSLAVGHVMPLSICTDEYDIGRDGGFKNIGEWIDAAAIQAGR